LGGWIKTISRTKIGYKGAVTGRLGYARRPLRPGWRPLPSNFLIGLGRPGRWAKGVALSDPARNIATAAIGRPARSNPLAGSVAARGGTDGAGGPAAEAGSANIASGLRGRRGGEAGARHAKRRR